MSVKQAVTGATERGGRWVLALACGHEKMVASKRPPRTGKMVPCPRCAPRTRLAAVNVKRAAAMRERNFPKAETVKQWCLVRRLLQAHQRRHGAKAKPDGWLACWGPVDPAHVTPRGNGGCNSDKDDVVDLCRGHHREQEGRTAEFEAKYGVDLKAEAARRAAGERDPLPPA